MNTLDWISRILVVIGAIAWGLIGAFDWNLVTTIFGEGTFANVVFILVGLAGIWELIKLFKK